MPEPARKMSADVRSVHSLTVTWDVPSSGGLTEYRVNVQGQAGSEQTVAEDAKRTVTFTGLVAGAPYTVVMVTVSGERRSSAIQKAFYTRTFVKCPTPTSIYVATIPNFRYIPLISNLFIIYHLLIICLLYIIYL